MWQKIQDFTRDSDLIKPSDSLVSLSHNANLNFDDSQKNVTFTDMMMKLFLIVCQVFTCCSNTQQCSYNTLELTTRQKYVIYEDKPKTRQERVLHNTPKCVSKQHTKFVLSCNTRLK